MLIVSWNVAGLKPALQKIHTDYATSSGTASSSATSTSKPNPFATFLSKHGDVSILCLQEHKIPLASLSQRCEPHRCSTIPGYESFWSCATDAKSRGFNGVVTYVKAGLVQSADCNPLQDEELDSQGRCVMTNHGDWVLFNVYVPNGSGTTEGLVNKIKFLNALRSAMKRQREEGKRVMLVGDMNAKIDKRDLFWRHRVLNVDIVLEGLKREREGGRDVPKWKIDLERHWDAISSVCETMEAFPCQTTNPTTKKTFDRFRARIKLPDDRYIFLGSYEESAEDALDYYNLSELYYDNPRTGESTLTCKKNVISIEALAELMSKIGDVTWDDKILREISESEETGLNPDSPSFQWMKSLVDEDGMVDVFRHYYPNAEARFTVWHQFTNKRYTNEGSRIDFTFVDKTLLASVQQGDDQTLRCGTQAHDNPLGEEAALLAATANGMFESGTFAGGGIATPTQRALDSQFGPKHTGMIYTPPTYSDHIAVSLLMTDAFIQSMGQLTLDEKESATRKAQPHKKQRSISSFFGTAQPHKKQPSLANTSIASADKKRVAASETDAPKKKTLSFFGNPYGSNKSAPTAKSKSTTKSTATKSKKIPNNNILNHFKK